MVMRIIISEKQYNMLFEENNQKVNFTVKENKKGSKVLFLNVNNQVTMFVLVTKINNSDVFLNNFDTSNDTFSKMFMTFIIDYFRENNVKKIFVKAKTNEIDFYKTYGYVKRDSNFVGEDDLYDNIWMYKELT